MRLIWIDEMTGDKLGLWIQLAVGVDLPRIKRSERASPPMVRISAVTKSVCIGVKLTTVSIAGTSRPRYSIGSWRARISYVGTSSANSRKAGDVNSE